MPATGKKGVMTPNFCRSVGQFSTNLATPPREQSNPDGDATRTGQRYTVCQCPSRRTNGDYSQAGQHHCISNLPERHLKPPYQSYFAYQKSLQSALWQLRLLFIKQEPGQVALIHQDQWLGRRRPAGVTGKCKVSLHFFGHFGRRS